MSAASLVVLESTGAGDYFGYGDSYTRTLMLLNPPNPVADAAHQRWLLQLKAEEQRRQQRIEQWRLNDKRGS